MPDPRFPLNRVVAFLAPFVALLAGSIAAWLVDHFPGLGVDQAALSGDIAQAITFLVGAAAVQLSANKWLDGWQKWQHDVADPHSLAQEDGTVGNAWHPLDDPFAPPVEDEDEVDEDPLPVAPPSDRKFDDSAPA